MVNEPPVMKSEEFVFSPYFIPGGFNIIVNK